MQNITMPVDLYSEDVKCIKVHNIKTKYVQWYERYADQDL